MGRKITVPEPVSAGIILSYKCTSSCRHCRFAGSPAWKADWMSEDLLKRTLGFLAGRIAPAPDGPDGVGINQGLCFTGGEPFLNFDLLIKAARQAAALGIPSTFVETNGFWCKDDLTAKYNFLDLKEAGLKGVLVSVNPFIAEEVPFERTARAVRYGREAFGKSCIVHQEHYFYQFLRLGITGKMTFREYLARGRDGLSQAELLPMGRAAYAPDLFRKQPAAAFFGHQCRTELLDPRRAYFDNYGNYITGYCGGIALSSLDRLSNGDRELDPDEHPVIAALFTDIKELHDLAVGDLGYLPKARGYVSKCHLCVDIRRHLAFSGDRFAELRPREFYSRLEDPRSAP
jgi:hypothetical protein